MKVRGCCVIAGALILAWVGLRASGFAQITPMYTVATWNTTATDHRGQNGMRFAYYCPPATSLDSARTIWGSVIYTDDSGVCLAGAHTGAIVWQYGGVVIIEVRPPQQGGYMMSTRNGITSMAYSTPYAGAFEVIARSRPNAPTLLFPPSAFSPPLALPVVLSWRDNGNVDGYQNEFLLDLMSRRPDDLTNWQSIETNTKLGTRTSVEVTSSLRPNLCYQWRIWAVDPLAPLNPPYSVSDWAGFCTGAF